MSDTNRMQERRKRLRDAGKAPVTVWLSREEKRRLEALAKTWHCSTSELVQQALGAFHPASPPGTAAITDTEQLRQCITETVSDIVTATLPALVRETVEELAREQATRPATAPKSRGVTVPKTPQRVPVGHPSPEKAAVVARLWEMRTQGMSLAQVAAELQAEGVPTLSGKGIWQKGTVAKLLRKK
jgi:Recombinase